MGLSLSLSQMLLYHQAWQPHSRQEGGKSKGQNTKGMCQWSPCISKSYPGSSIRWLSHTSLRPEMDHTVSPNCNGVWETGHCWSKWNQILMLERKGRKERVGKKRISERKPLISGTQVCMWNERNRLRVFWHLGGLRELLKIAFVPGNWGASHLISFHFLISENACNDLPLRP